MNFGKIIYDLRKKKGITQEEMAAELGVTAAAVSKWEKGYSLPDILMLCSLADYFEVTADELLGRAPKPLCAAVATSVSPQLAQQIAELVKQYGFSVKYILYGSYEEALDVVSNDTTFTHLFASYEEPMPEYRTRDTNVHIIASCADTPESTLRGFDIYLKNMPHFSALVGKDNA